MTIIIEAAKTCKDKFVYNFFDMGHGFEEPCKRYTLINSSNESYMISIASL